MTIWRKRVREIFKLLHQEFIELDKNHTYQITFRKNLDKRINNDKEIIILGTTRLSKFQTILLTDNYWYLLSTKHRITFLHQGQYKNGDDFLKVGEIMGEYVGINDCC